MAKVRSLQEPFLAPAREWGVVVCLALSVLTACGGSQPLPLKSTVVEPATPVSLAPSEPTPAAPRGQLAKDAVPTHYRIDLDIDPDTETFKGHVSINVALAKATSLIWLHGLDLSVTRATALVGNERISAEWRPSEEEGVVAFIPSRALPGGQVVLEIDYSAEFNRKLRGLYKVKSGGNAYAFTQFESISARSAFPCFDEPAFKTPFDVSLTVPAKYAAIANTIENAQAPAGPGLAKHSFRTTEKLPTYLVAFAVGPFDVVEHAPIAATAIRPSALPFRGIAPKGKGKLLERALQETGPILQALENYFGIAYPYDKLDILAVPDFASGAMENAGAITFREWLLLMDPATADESQRRAFAQVMAHELAHQWFGNLVTMPWWDDTWLNEGFATWMGQRIVAELYPEQDVPVTQLASMQIALRTDSLTSARQIRQPIRDNHDIQNAFDSITYKKGGGVLAMFERFMGRDTFQKGIRAYLQQHRFGNATESDLVQALDTAAGKPVSPAFRSFLEQPGVPLVDVKVSCDATSAALDLRQTRYFPQGSPGNSAQQWIIPVCVRYGSRGKVLETCELLDAASKRINLSSAGCPDWVLPNADGVGYYRWLLDDNSVNRLRTTGFTRLSAAEKFAFADSLAAGFDTGRLKPDQVFRGLELLAHDANRTIAETPLKILDFTSNYLVDPADRERVASFGRRLYSATFQRLGFTARPQESGENRLLRLSLLKFLNVVARDPQTLQQSQKLGKRFLAAQAGNGDAVAATLPQEIVAPVLDAVVREGGAAEFDAVLQRFLTTENPRLRVSFLGALGAARDPEQSKRALELAFDERLRVNEIHATLSAQLERPETRDLAWGWFKQNFDRLLRRTAVTRAGDMPWFAQYFCSEEAAREVEAVFTPHIDEMMGGPRNLRSVLEMIRVCAARVPAQKPAVTQFFTPLR